MKKILPQITAPATSAITATSADKLQYLCNVQRLSELFYTGHRYILSHNVTPAVWSTIHEPLADGFIRKYADPLCLLGVGFGDYTNYLMGDIDRYSKYHPSNDPQAFKRILDTLHRKGLTTPVVIQSSWSGGIHLYYFFDRNFNTFRVASLALVALADDGLEIKDGHLELFPNCKPYADQFEDKSDHKRHRLPLQPKNGGAILDRNGNPLMCGANLSHESQLQAFLQLAKASARGNDSAKIERQLDPFYGIFTSCPSKYQHIQKKGLSDRAKAWKIDLEARMGIGWTSFHQTNELIPRFIAYGIVFMGIEDENELFQWVLESIINANGYKQYCRHQHQIEARIWDWLKLTTDKQFYVKYCGYPPRSKDRAGYIAKHKVSKSVPTPKSEVYKRSRVDSVVSTITDVVETILSTIADLPSRTEDLIRLIQSIAREKFGQAPSRNTLYKPHYKTIWVKLKATNKLCDIVPITPNTYTNMEYCPKTCTESAFEGSIFRVTDSDEKDLKPIGGETSHSTRSVCRVNASSELSQVNEADPDPDLDLNLKNIPLDPEPIESIRTYDLIDLDINPQPDSIEPALEEDLSSDPINSDSIEPSGADLSNRPSHDRFISIDPDPDSSHPVLIEPDPDLINLQSALPNFDTSYQTDQIEPPGADLITRSAHNHPQSIELDPIEPDPIESDLIELDLIKPNPIESDLIEPNPTDRDKSIQPDLTDSISYHTQDNPTEPDPKLQARDLSLDPIEPNSIREQQLASLSLIRGCAVRTTNSYHVHGAKRGMVTSVESWGVYVNWWDGATGRYSPDELICTYRPNSRC